MNGGYDTLWCAGCKSTFYAPPSFSDAPWTAWDMLNHHVRHDREHRNDVERQRWVIRDDYARYLRERGVI